ncbi:MAG TPA: sugar ABC transporter ATP-binding protein [Pusillimonas sp.]|uniref:sugar ABC transporter ATP-binding protein n=1 Tax=Pusillimonas sp. TaxID=3040095 RepID=UPI002B4ABC09|nr:sugar ABC transporter ATP-binding protein [Pusillimonas sp.]HLU19191.1 sugar ABC transporter ATP-binding protein [Pusillimonas sp.]
MRLEIKNISKQFSRSKALDDVSITVTGGTILALLGENGAGKSTLIKILSGIYKADSGTILINGEPVAFNTPSEAMEAGVVLVPQELRVVPQLSVAENILLGRLPVRRLAGVLPSLDRKAVRETAAQVLSQLGIDLNPDVLAGSLDFASRQLIVIARALSRRARILILDEPTASLERQEVERLFSVIRRLKDQGVAIIYISHRLEEIEQLADACVILRDGRVAESISAPPFAHDVLVRAMTGRELQQASPAVRQAGPEKATLAIGAEQVTGRTHRVVGLSGLLGSGTTALLHKAFGSLDRSNKAMSAQSTREAIRAGMGLVPGERSKALVMPMSIRDNIILPHLSEFSTRFGRDEARIDAVVNALMETFDIRPRDPHMPVGHLSGGNQQKVAFAKWMTGHLELLLLDEPTNGIDIAAKALIHDYIDRFVAQSGAVFLSSTDLPELLSLSDEVVVMKQGQYVGRMCRDSADDEFGEHKLRSLLGIG